MKYKTRREDGTLISASQKENFTCLCTYTQKTTLSSTLGVVKDIWQTRLDLKCKVMKGKFQQFHQFHQYQQNERSLLILTELTEHNKTTTCDVRNIIPSLGQTHKLWGLCKLTRSFKLCLLCFFF